MQVGKELDTMVIEVIKELFSHEILKEKLLSSLSQAGTQSSVGPDGTDSESYNQTVMSEMNFYLIHK